MKKGLINVFFANILCLVINLLINFLLPKYVSIDSYSLIKTYALYISYAGFFSIGYNDGMYLKYGGKNLDEINKEELATNFINYVILIMLMFIVLLFVSISIRNNILFAFSFGMVSYNLLGYLKSLYQATGNFKLYGYALNAEKILIFILIIFSIFYLHSDNYLLYIWVQVIVGILIAIFLTVKLEKKLSFIKKGKLRFKEIIENVKSGFVLMLGNFSSGFFTSMDRWFVKILLTSFDFAMYSFSASMESIVNVFISPITVTMYNFFCKKPKKEDILKIKNLSLIYGFIVIAAAYPAKFILEHYLVEYINSCKLIFFLFGAQLFYIIIKGIYVNLYKANKKQNTYLFQMLIMIVIGFILNIIFYSIFRNNESIALATFVTAVIWLILCEIGESTYRFNFKDIIAIILVVSIYFYTGYYTNSIIGCIIYVISVILICSIFMRDNIVYIFKNIESFKNKLLRN